MDERKLNYNLLSEEDIQLFFKKLSNSSTISEELLNSFYFMFGTDIFFIIESISGHVFPNMKCITNIYNSIITEKNKGE